MNWQKIVRRALTAFLIVIFALSAAIVGAAVQIFDGAGQYIMSDFEKHDIAKQRAQQRAERDAQKKAGVALKTFSRSINSELTDDEVSAVTNNIIRVTDVKIVPVTFEAEGEAGLMYKATLKATIDTDGIYAWLKRNDKEKVTIIQRNNELQDSIQKNDKQVEDLKEQYRRTTTQAEKDSIIKQMNNTDRNFLVNQKLEEGNKLYYAKDYHKAIRIYNEILKFGEYREVYTNRGTAYLGLNQYERAISDFNKAIQLNPNDSLAYTNRGIAYLNLKHHDKAIQDFDKAIQLNPNDDKAYYNRGTFYGKYLGEYDKAIQDFNKTIQFNPNFAGAYYNRAMAYSKLRKYDLAIQDYSKTIQLNPNDDAAYNNRGVVYARIGNFKQAVADVTKAIELNPNDPKQYQFRGICYQELGETAKAQADFAKAKELGYNG